MKNYNTVGSGSGHDTSRTVTILSLCMRVKPQVKEVNVIIVKDTQSSIAYLH